jgi:hypothetical protein
MNEPFELLPGRTYVLEHPVCLSEKVKIRILESLRSQTERLNCHFILLDGGMKIAREEKQEEDQEENPTKPWVSPVDTTKPWGSHQDWLDLIHETLNK